MNDALIDRLAADLGPVRRGTVPRHLALALLAGGILAALAFWIGLGVRADLVTALGTPVFWIKFAYPLLLGIGGYLAVERLARPAGTGRRGFLLAGAALVASIVLALVQLAMASPEDIRILVMGGSALVCPFLIVALSAPILAATLLVMRRLAPTDLTRAGWAAGLFAGGAGAWIYAFHCGESGLPFLAIWYTLGVLITATLGALIGRLALRW